MSTTNTNEISIGMFTINILGMAALLFFNAWFFDFSVVKTVDGSIVGLSTEMSNWMRENIIITVIVIFISIFGGVIIFGSIGILVCSISIVIGIIALFLSSIGYLITDDIFSLMKPLRFIGWNVGMLFICGGMWLFLALLLELNSD